MFIPINLVIKINKYVYGRVGEWFMPAVLKTAERQRSVSSNLTSSAIIKKVHCATIQTKIPQTIISTKVQVQRVDRYCT
jgi:hypothetical protein